VPRSCASPRHRPRPRAALLSGTAALLCALLAAGPARAADNDLALYLLGNPDPISTCTKCDGSDRKARAADPKAQARFARMSSALGLAFVPAFVDAANSTGQAGFEIGFSETASFLTLNADEWASQGSSSAAQANGEMLANSAAPAVLSVTTLSLRKGLGGSVELGAHLSYLAASQIFAVGAQLRWSLIDGIDYAPDLALRLWGNRLVGTGELGLSGLGGDLLLSKSWAFGGSARFQPYGQLGLALLNATSDVVDFNPGHQDPHDPTASDAAFHTISLIDNRFTRLALGLRLIAGSVLLGLEGSMAFGTVPVQHDALAGGAAPADQTTKQYAASARLGLSF
jgi:hypothetical protein